MFHELASRLAFDVVAETLPLETAAGDPIAQPLFTWPVIAVLAVVLAVAAAAAVILIRIIKKNRKA